MKKTLIVFSLMASLMAGSVMALEQQSQSGWPYRASQNAVKADVSEPYYDTAVCLSSEEASTPATAFACCGHEHEGASYTWSLMTSTQCANNPPAYHPDQQGIYCTNTTATTTSPSSSEQVSEACLFS